MVLLICFGMKPLYKDCAMIEYLLENKEWMFSGIGVAVISWLLFRNSNSLNMSQKSGKNSTNVQAGGNFTMNKKDDTDGNK